MGKPLSLCSPGCLLTLKSELRLQVSLKMCIDLCSEALKCTYITLLNVITHGRDRTQTNQVCL